MIRSTVLLVAALGCCAGFADPVVYEMDPAHTFPSFEGDHFGISFWRGKFEKTSGSITIDRAANTGTVDVVIDATSIDFGLEVMNEHARAPDFLDVAKYPQITYRGQLAGFVDGVPTRLEGQMSLHGVTKPLTLEIKRFKCMLHPMSKRDYCGADAFGTFQRDEYGLTAGQDWGFGMEVTLRIQVEAVAKE